MSDEHTGAEPVASAEKGQGSCAKRQLLAALTTSDVTIRRLDL
jgi:hypothetical protein